MATPTVAIPPPPGAGSGGGGVGPERGAGAGMGMGVGVGVGVASLVGGGVIGVSAASSGSHKASSSAGSGSHSASVTPSSSSPSTAPSPLLASQFHGSSITNRELRCNQCGRRPPCHHQLHPRRANKLRHRGATTSVSATANSNPTSDNAANPSGSAPAQSHDSANIPSFYPYPDMTDPEVLSYWGTDPVPLPSRFARIKRDLVAGHEAALQASWTRLLHALRLETERIEDLGAHLIPSIQYTDIDDPAQTQRFADALKRYGVGVVRAVVPPRDADDAVQETVRYVDAADRQAFKTPPPQDPTCYDFFWTPAQVRMRAHPNVLTAQRFMMSQWETSPSDRLSIRCPVTYADRIRIHGTTLNQNAESPKTNGAPPALYAPQGATLSSPVSGSTGGAAQSSALNNGPKPPASADDWLNAIQSSTIIAQVDNGSLERWEPDGYTRGGTYAPIFAGNFEAYDPWSPTGRIATSTDLYNGYGACSIFRMFQGVLALSTIEPGMIRLLPSPKLATAYFLLRPFFNPMTAPPAAREGPEWDAFLAPENWRLDREQNTIIHGAVPGHAQRLTELWHPHLHLRRSLVTLPTLRAGDYILWHPDLPYHISSGEEPAPPPAPRNIGSASEEGASMLVYIPAAPLTQTNALYLARQRKAFLRGFPGPDFDSTGSGLGSEAHLPIRLGEADVGAIGGPEGLRAMGLVPWEVAGTPKGDPVAPGVGKELNGVDDVDMVGTGSGAQTPTSSTHVEDEVVRLANIIAFPDQCMMGFPAYEGVHRR